MGKIHFIDFYFAIGDCEWGENPHALDALGGLEYLDVLNEFYCGEKVPADPTDPRWEEVFVAATFR